MISSAARTLRSISPAKVWTEPDDGGGNTVMSAITTAKTSVDIVIKADAVDIRIVLDGQSIPTAHHGALGRSPTERAHDESGAATRRAPAGAAAT